MLAVAFWILILLMLLVALMYGAQSLNRLRIRYTVEHLNNGHIRAAILSFVGRLSLSPRLTSKPHASILICWGVCLWGRSNQRFYADTFRTDPRWSKSTKLNWLSRCCWVTHCWNLTMTSPVDSMSILGGYFVQLTVIWGAHILSIVRSLEVVCISEVENVLVLW